jgi:pyruvate dehydrogenase E1 component
LNGEGVQHQDGHSHLLSATVPNLKSYDPAFGYEIALIVREGIRRMYAEQEDLFYYLTVTNQPYRMPALPDGDDVEAGVLAGMYCLDRRPEAEVNLFGSGAIMNEVLRARDLLSDMDIPASVWSVTSYTELARQATAVERERLMGIGQVAQQPHVAQQLADARGAFVAATDYMKALPMSISRWVPGPYTVLGTDGFGLSEARTDLRDYFEVSAEWIAFGALSTLAQEGRLPRQTVQRFAEQAGIDLTKADPALA